MARVSQQAGKQFEMTNCEGVNEMNDKERAWSFEKQLDEMRKKSSVWYNQNCVLLEALSFHAKNGGMTEEKITKLLKDVEEINFW
ncbi:hypothetical protein [Exiguobacterium oxidotolerans]|uniref:hypothetical protein n=1 Tax=Exiguobacterium oxidotolerans TaxID=223958 RepID=UPI000494C8BA|nr:hypothetical protein [Exiguobacterium oxidotolerans]